MKPVIKRLRRALDGRYTIQREFATVSLADDVKHRRQIALKVHFWQPVKSTGGA